MASPARRNFQFAAETGEAGEGWGGGGGGAKAHSPLPFLRNKELLGGKSLQFPYFKPLVIPLPPPHRKKKRFRHHYTVLAGTKGSVRV